MNTTLTSPDRHVIIGWHFAREGNALGYGDDRKIILGKTLAVDARQIVPCKFGLHASASALDALSYAAGPHLWKVELSGTVIPHGDPVDKYAASKRKALAGGMTATPMLRVFARQCALDVMHLWNAPDVVREYLETGKDDIRDAARDAAWAVRAAKDAWDAARAAAWDAAWDAARGAARAAARGAAWDAAWDATWDAERDAAWDAERDAARDAQRARFEAMCEEFVATGKVPEIKMPEAK